MTGFFAMTWTVLIGLSFLFVGGFVLWVYGTHTPHRAGDVAGQEAEATRKFHHHLVQWFFLYGVGAVIIGAICLVAAAIAMI